MASLVYDRAVERGMGVELPVKQQTKALRRGRSAQVRAWAAS
jgi:hypothetical protein